MIERRAAMKELIGFCGLDCEKCDAYIATKNDDDELRKKTAELWSKLNNVLIQPEHINCEGCRVDGVKTVFCDSLCEIRKCAIAKKIGTCGECSDMHDCKTLGMITDNNLQALENLSTKPIPNEAQEILIERFGVDSLISLATIDDEFPSVRTVNAYYEDGSFYVITYALSNKMIQIKNNPNVAISGNWFTAHGKGESLGWFCKEENMVIAKKLKIAFHEWIDNGHNNFDDENTIILRIKLKDGVLLSHGTRYDLDFFVE